MLTLRGCAGGSPAFRRIPLYNAVNVLMGYPPLAIHSPLEVLFDDEEL